MYLLIKWSYMRWGLVNIVMIIESGQENLFRHEYKLLLVFPIRIYNIPYLKLLYGILNFPASILTQIKHDRNSHSCSFCTRWSESFQIERACMWDVINCILLMFLLWLLTKLGQTHYFYSRNILWKSGVLHDGTRL